MANNPFDQFDSATPAAPAAANPFDQFDAASAAPNAMAPIDRQMASNAFYAAQADNDTQTMGNIVKSLQASGQTLAPPSQQQITAATPSQGAGQEALWGGVHAIVKPVAGLAQIGSGMYGSAIDAILPQGNTFRQSTDETTKSANDWLTQQENQYQSAVPNSLSADAGAVAGNVLPFLFEAPAKALQIVGDGARFLPEAPQAIQAAADYVPTIAQRLAKYGNNILSGSAQGGTIAALQPVTNQINDNDSYANQKLAQIGTGLAVGGAVPAVTAPIGAVASGIKNALANFTNPEAVAANNLGRTLQATPDTLNALTNYQAPVAGVTPTTAQILATPQAAMVEKAAGNNPAVKQSLEEIANTNNAARVAALQNIAKTPADLQAALDARRTMANTFTQANLAPGHNPVDATPIIQSLSSIQDNTLRPAIKNGVGDMLSDIQGSLNPDGTINAGLLDDLRQNANDYLAKHSPNGVVPSQVQAVLGPIKHQIQQSLSTAVPGYSQYLGDYAKLSQPINDMQAAQAILSPSANGALNSAGDARLTLAQVNAGLKKSDGSQYGLSPQAEQQVRNIQQSLQQESIPNSVRTPGSDTNYNAQAQGWLGKQILGQGNPVVSTLGKGVLPAIGGAIGNAIGGIEGAGAGVGIGSGLNKLLGTTADVFNQRITDAYNQGVLDPNVARGMVAKYLNQNQAQAPSLLARYPQWRALLSGMPAQQQQTSGATP